MVIGCGIAPKDVEAVKMNGSKALRDVPHAGNGLRRFQVGEAIPKSAIRRMETGIIQQDERILGYNGNIINVSSSSIEDLWR